LWISGTSITLCSSDSKIKQKLKLPSFIAFENVRSGNRSGTFRHSQDTDEAHT